MTTLPSFGTSKIQCGKRGCKWQGFETQLVKTPLPLKPGEKIGVSKNLCPRCGGDGYYFIAGAFGAPNDQVVTDPAEIEAAFEVDQAAEDAPAAAFPMPYVGFPDIENSGPSDALRQALAVAISMLMARGLVLRASLVDPVTDALGAAVVADPQDYFEAALLPQGAR